MGKIFAVLAVLSGLLFLGPSSSARALELSSPAFKSGGNIPSHYARPAAGGHNMSVPLQWSGVPDGTKSFALVIVDVHPVANKWVHWMVVNIPPNVTALPDNASANKMPPGAVQFKNSFGTTGYGGPQPPRGTGSHEYVITLYALRSDKLDLKPDAALPDFLNALKGKVIQEASISGMYQQ